MAKHYWRNHRDAVHARELANYQAEKERKKETILPDFGFLQRLGGGSSRRDTQELMTVKKESEATPGGLSAQPVGMQRTGHNAAAARPQQPSVPLLGRGPPQQDMEVDGSQAHQLSQPQSQQAQQSSLQQHQNAQTQLSIERMQQQQQSLMHQCEMEHQRAMRAQAERMQQEQHRMQQQAAAMHQQLEAQQATLRQAQHQQQLQVVQLQSAQQAALTSVLHQKPQEQTPPLQAAQQHAAMPQHVGAGAQQPRSLPQSTQRAAVRGADQASADMDTAQPQQHSVQPQQQTSAHWWTAQAMAQTYQTGPASHCQPRSMPQSAVSNGAAAAADWIKQQGQQAAMQHLVAEQQQKQASAAHAQAQTAAASGTTIPTSAWTSEASRGERWAPTGRPEVPPPTQQSPPAQATTQQPQPQQTTVTQPQAQRREPDPAEPQYMPQTSGDGPPSFSNSPSQPLNTQEQEQALEQVFKEEQAEREEQLRDYANAVTRRDWLEDMKMRGVEEEFLRNEYERRFGVSFNRSELTEAPDPPPGQWRQQPGDHYDTWYHHDWEQEWTTEQWAQWEHEHHGSPTKGTPQATSPRPTPAKQPRAAEEARVPATSARTDTPTQSAAELTRALATAMGEEDSATEEEPDLRPRSLDGGISTVPPGRPRRSHQRRQPRHSRATPSPQQRASQPARRQSRKTCLRTRFSLSSPPGSPPTRSRLSACSSTWTTQSCSPCFRTWTT